MNIVADRFRDGALNHGVVISALHEFEETKHPRDKFGKWAHVGELTKTGPAKGSNPGGTYKDAAGTEYYIKHYGNAAQYDAELAAQNAYRAVGIQTADSKKIDVNGKHGIASPMVKTVAIGQTALKKWADDNPGDAARVFAASVVTQNWDVVGLSFDNLLVMDHTPSGVKAAVGVVDTGGSFTFRAKGGSKLYTTEPTEFHTLRDPNGKNSQAAAVFRDVLNTKEGRQAAFDAFQTFKNLYGDGSLQPPSGVTAEQVYSKADASQFLILQMPPIDASGVETIQVHASVVKEDGSVNLAKLKANAEAVANGFLLAKIKKGSGLSLESTGKLHWSKGKDTNLAKALAIMKECKTVDEYLEKAKGTFNPGRALNRLKEAQKKGYILVTNTEGQKIAHQYAEKIASEKSLIKSSKSASEIKAEQKTIDDHVASPPSRAAVLAAAWAKWDAQDQYSIKNYGSYVTSAGATIRASMMPKEVHEIILYSDGKYSTINPEVAKGVISESSKRLARAIACHPNKFQGNLWRRDQISHYSKETMNFTTMKAGQVIESPVFWSTTTKDLSIDVHTSLVWHISEAKSGASIKSISLHPGEEEVLYRPRTKFEFIKTESIPYGGGLPSQKGNMRLHVYIKEIGEGGV